MIMNDKSFYEEYMIVGVYVRRKTTWRFSCIDDVMMISLHLNDMPFPLF